MGDVILLYGVAFELAADIIFRIFLLASTPPLKLLSINAVIYTSAF